MGEGTIESWDDIYDGKIDKNSVNEILNQFNRLRAKTILLDSTRKKSMISIDSLRNNIITNINFMFGEKFKLKDIEKAYEFLKRKHKNKLLNMGESDVNSLVVELLFNPEQMNDKVKKDKQIEYDLPTIELPT